MTLREELAKEEADHERTIAERDRVEAWADKLAYAIAKKCGADIGEHSSHNNPWANALALIESA